MAIGYILSEDLRYDGPNYIIYIWTNFLFHKLILYKHKFLKVIIIEKYVMSVIIHYTNRTR